MFNVLKAIDFTTEILQKLFWRANDLREMRLTRTGRRSMREICRELKLYIVMFEASTRTRFAFHDAAAELGMVVIPEGNAAENSSAKKGECLSDMMRSLAAYHPDLIVLRHPQIGAAEEAVRAIARSRRPVPLINGGDGSGEHPSQAVVDSYLIWRRFGWRAGLTYTVLGDLKHGRAARSFAKIIIRFPKPKIILVSPPEFQIGNDVIQFLADHGIVPEQTDDLRSALPRSNVVYATRPQLERLSDPDLAQSLRDRYTIGPAEMECLPSDAILMHPFPRDSRHPEITPEIDPVVDSDPRAVYFEQMEEGQPVREALIEHVLSVNGFL